jgi:hypothetical protein
LIGIAPNFIQFSPAPLSILCLSVYPCLSLSFPTGFRNALSTGCAYLLLNLFLTALCFCCYIMTDNFFPSHLLIFLAFMKYLFILWS